MDRKEEQGEKNKEYVFFTNGKAKFSIGATLLPFQVEKQVGDEEPMFCDFDSDNLRAVLNFYRNGADEKLLTPTLRYDIGRFITENHENECVKITVGHEEFYSTAKTLSKLPYFEAVLKFSKKISANNIDRDPVLFSEILSRLRHPLQHCAPKTKELHNELIFWGIASPKTEFPLDEQGKDGKRLVTKTTKLPVMRIADMGLQAISQQSLFYAYNLQPEISLFVHNYLRYTAFKKNTVVLTRRVERDSLEFELENHPHIDVINSTYLAIETQFPISCLEELFDSVTVTFTLEEDETQTVSFTQSTRLMTMLASLRRVEPFTVQESKSVNYVCIPLRFFFCALTTLAFPAACGAKMTVSLACRGAHSVNNNVESTGASCSSSSNSSEAQEEKNNTILGCKYRCNVLCDTYFLSNDEKDAFRQRENEYLIDNHRCLFEGMVPSEDGRVTVSRVLERTTIVRAIYVIAYDKKTKQSVPCLLDGTITIDKVWNFALNSIQNQMAQSRHFGETPYNAYDPKLWFVSLSTRCLTSFIPSGHQVFNGGCTINVDFTVESDCRDIAFDVWFGQYDVLRCSETSLELFDFPTDKPKKSKPKPRMPADWKQQNGYGDDDFEAGQVEPETEAPAVVDAILPAHQFGRLLQTRMSFSSAHDASTSHLPPRALFSDRNYRFANDDDEENNEEDNNNNEDEKNSNNNDDEDGKGEEEGNEKE